MPRPNHRVPLLLLVAIAPSVSAEVPLDAIGDTELFLDGLLQADWNRFDADATPIGDEAELRRAELVLRGRHESGWEFVAGYDLKADKWLDAGLRRRFGGNVQFALGQFKQPSGLEELGSTRTNDFIAKSMATNTFAPSRRLGLMLGAEGRNWTAAGSVFGRELTRGLARGSGFGARATWAPWLASDGAGGTSFLHLGLSAVDFDTPGDTLRLRARPGADLTAIRLVDTDTLADTDRMRSLGVEAAWSHGPWLLQGEAFRARVSRTAGSDFEAGGHYLQALWTLTGEGHGYRQGTIGTPLPEAPQRGMWQIGLRHDAIDFDHGAVRGGEQHNLTLGLNWYWRSHFKFMANLVDARSERRGLRDDPRVFELRAQLAF